MPAGQGRAGIRQSILYLVPKAGAAQRFFDDGIHICLGCGKAVDARAISDIFVDRLGKWIRLLEHHADAGAQLHDIHCVTVNVFAVQIDRSFNAARRNGIVHAVQRPQESGLAAT